MDALVDAYLARSVEPLVRLRDEFGVTHLLVEKRHFDGHPPSYFAPFEARIHDRLNALGGTLPAGLQPEQAVAVVYQDPSVVLLDLRLLPGGMLLP